MKRYEITVSMVEIDDECNIVDEDAGDFSFQIESDNPKKAIVDAMDSNPTFSDLCT